MSLMPPKRLKPTKPAQLIAAVQELMDWLFQNVIITAPLPVPIPPATRATINQYWLSGWGNEIGYSSELTSADFATYEGSL